MNTGINRQEKREGERSGREKRMRINKQCTMRKIRITKKEKRNEHYYQMRKRERRYDIGKKIRKLLRRWKRKERKVGRLNEINRI